MTFLKLEKRGELQTLPLSVIQWLATKITFISRCVFRLLHLGKFTAWILRTEGEATCANFSRAKMTLD